MEILHSNSVSAAVVTWKADGVIINVFSLATKIFGTVQVGDPYSMTWTFDTATPLSEGDGVTSATYLNALLESSFTVDGVTLSGPVGSINGLAPRLSFGIGGSFIVAPPGVIRFSDNVNGAWVVDPNAEYIFGFTMDSGALPAPPGYLKTVSLSAPPPDVTLFNSSPAFGVTNVQTSISVTNHGPALVGSIQALSLESPVPLPASFWLLGSVLSGFGLQLRRCTMR